MSIIKKALECVILTPTMKILLISFYIINLLLKIFDNV